MLGCAMAGRITENLERRVVLLEEPCARGHLTACGNLGAALSARSNGPSCDSMGEATEKGWVARRVHQKRCRSTIVVRAGFGARLSTRERIAVGWPRYRGASARVMPLAVERSATFG